MNRLLLLSGFLTMTFTGYAGEPLSFNRDIRPILSDKCFSCHGPDKNSREADLRLDVKEEAIAMEAITPGDLKASEVYWRIISDDEDELMPPPDVHKPLSGEEKKLIERWIEEGAKYEAHWAYLPVKRPPVSDGGTSPIDIFVREGLKKKGLTPSEKADDATLLRRLHFDITGLPPVPGDLARFQAAGLSAYLDELLAKPHFGERMAMEWLDAVRYADSVGYHGDQSIEVSLYRDWVIDAYNRDMPFDQFTIEQIAGDLLPKATISQQIAASYHRLGQSSQEGGIQDAEYLAKYQSERVRTTSTAWMGSTLACAECHDHKFDPYTAKDFYGFAAYFADILEKGAWTGDGAFQEDIAPYEKAGISFGQRGPQLVVPSEEELAKLEELTLSLKKAGDDFRKITPEFEASLAGWLGKTKAEIKSNEPSDYVYLEDRGEKNGVNTSGWEFVTAENGQVHSGEVARRQKADELIQHLTGSAKSPLRIHDGDVLYSYVWLNPENPPQQIMLQFHHEKSTWSHRASWGADFIPYGKGSDNDAHRKMGPLPAAGQWVRLEVPVAKVGLKTGDEVTQLAFTQYGGEAFWDTAGIFSSTGPYEFADIPAEIRDLLLKPESEITADEKSKLATHYRTFAPELKGVRAEVAKLEKEMTRLKQGMRTIPATVSAKPREIRILPRGNWMDKTGERVEPHPPHFLPVSDALPGKGTRLELAHWLVSPENPLTARTYVNRLWARFFGNGISGTVEDLGSQGRWPTHPELLDWLASEFVESGWDVKHLVRTIVLSDTYAQSSVSTPELEERDPYNRYLARQSGIRLPAELIRDNALTVSGLLNPAVGGRSARPYQPAGYYQHLNFPRREYEADKEGNQYRRGVYTHWQRTFLHPAMRAFDAPSREECTMRRDVSSTPLQALVLLNDPSFVEAAKVLAYGSEDFVDMFEKVLTRRPAPEELLVLEDLYASEKARLTATPTDADEILNVGLKAVEPEDRIDLAARVAVARTLLNLHETITRY
jgi:hypothetical protein